MKPTLAAVRFALHDFRAKPERAPGASPAAVALILLEGPQGLHDIDVSPLAAPGQRCRQLGSPGGRVHERGEVDVVRHPAVLEVGGAAGHKLIADLDQAFA